MDLNKINKILKKSYKMNWTFNQVPFGLIDIIRGCNCKCQACYNNANIYVKPYKKITEEIEIMLSRRQVSAIGIVGGEPLLHPDIFKIIEYIKQKNVSVEMLTNGILIDDEIALKLANSGLNQILLHIDIGQIRSDLNDNSNVDEVNKLREEKAKLLSKVGIDVGMSITLNKKELNTALSEYINCFKKSVSINTLLLTLYKDVSNYGTLYGDLENGMDGVYVERNIINEPSTTEVMDYFYKYDNSIPYWYITGTLNKNLPRWLMYLFAVNYDKHGILKNCLSLKYSCFEKLYLSYYLNKYHKYPTYKKRNKICNLIHIFFNGIIGRLIFRNIWFLLNSFDKQICMKRILVQELAEVTPQGVEYCENCPDAIIKNGKFVPNCISDNFGE